MSSGKAQVGHGGLGSTLGSRLCTAALRRFRRIESHLRRLDTSCRPAATAGNADAASLFRASGRFIWVPAYALILLSLAGLLKWLPARISTAVLVVALGLQLWEARKPISSLRPQLDTPAISLIDEAQLRSWMHGHRRIFQFPSWSCGGLWSRNLGERRENGFRELQINLLAARLGLSTNTVYTSRQVKDCAAEARWPLDAKMDNYVLYVFNKFDVDRTLSLAALSKSDAWTDAGWALVCSRKSLDDPSYPKGPLQD